MSVRALDAGDLVGLPTARALRERGLRWNPTAGDRFVLADVDMDGDVFVVSDMVADVQEFPSGRVIGFNGTVEWALDSVETEQALWLPAEDQLRRLLGGTFRRLESVGSPEDEAGGTAGTGALGSPGWAVTVMLPGQDRPTTFRAATAAQAYADALLQLLALAVD